ncbi:hypothetical protein AB1Y20_008603 [Prymnesium parvum]|uniref:Ribosome biogenesis protein NOP53 n=1 Tax=Prymnesium parvum TaxID=97485 RepID=A0AB34IQZ5_PRYPA
MKTRRPSLTTIAEGRELAFAPPAAEEFLSHDLSALALSPPTQPRALLLSDLLPDVPPPRLPRSIAIDKGRAPPAWFQRHCARVAALCAAEWLPPTPSPSPRCTPVDAAPAVWAGRHATLRAVLSRASQPAWGGGRPRAAASRRGSATGGGGAARAEAPRLGGAYAIGKASARTHGKHRRNVKEEAERRRRIERRRAAAAGEWEREVSRELQAVAIVADGGAAGMAVE